MPAGVAVNPREALARVATGDEALDDFPSISRRIRPDSRNSPAWRFAHCHRGLDRGERGMIAMERLMGLVLTAIAVEMLLAGIEGFITQLPR